MNRRRLLKLGSIPVISTFAVGSGAFSSVTAERTVTIAVADDEDAYLGLEDTSEYGRSFSFREPDVVEFSIPGVAERDATIGEGVGQNSTYEFDDLLEITNQGEDTVIVFSDSESSGPIENVSLTGPENILDSKSSGVELTPGEMFRSGLYIETTDGLGEFQTTISIKAEAPDTS